MKKIKTFLKGIWPLNFLRRIYLASTYYHKKFLEIAKWGFTSNEDTNFTYDLTDRNIKALVHSIAISTKQEYHTIMGYIEEINTNTQLKDRIQEIIARSPQGKFADQTIRFGKRAGWYAIVRAIKPKIIVETGVDKGLGAVVLCAALAKNEEEGFTGSYYGTDINLKAGYLLQGMNEEYGKILYGDSIESLSNFDQKIDLFINDSDHSQEYEYKEYLTIQSKLSDDAVIIGDKSHVTDKLANFSLLTHRKFILFREDPKDHWYPGGGIGISYM